MKTISSSAASFEDWQRRLLGSDFVEADLERKHKKMRKGAFPFLRATYWRWAEIVFEVVPHLRNAAEVLAIGDTHLENFGTWRDGEGRLVWGANDFDEACVMPWPLDLVRLATSALLAAGAGGDRSRICSTLWEGYRAGLASPSPIILERDREWLRESLLLDEDERRDFWREFDQPAEIVPPAYLSVLRTSLPQGEGEPDCFARQAGTGSLGRPRFVAHLRMWRGGPIIREAKALLPSAWTLFHDREDQAVGLIHIAAGAFRSPDPHYQVRSNILVRRLSPSSRKIEANEKGQFLLEPKMLRLMGREVGNCHAGDRKRFAAVYSEVMGKEDVWLEKEATAMARAVERDHRAFP
jgi:hypothetical protein